MQAAEIDLDLQTRLNEGPNTSSLWIYCKSVQRFRRYLPKTLFLVRDDLDLDIHTCLSETSSLWIWHKSIRRFQIYLIHRQKNKSQTTLKAELYAVYLLHQKQNLKQFTTVCGNQWDRLLLACQPTDSVKAPEGNFKVLTPGLQPVIFSNWTCSLSLSSSS